jgi:hypothetical protein
VVDHVPEPRGDDAAQGAVPLAGGVQGVCGADEGRERLKTGQCRYRGR